MKRYYMISYTDKFNNCSSFNVVGAHERDINICAMLVCKDYYKSISYRQIKSDGTYGDVKVIKSLLVNRKPRIYKEKR